MASKQRRCYASVCSFARSNDAHREIGSTIVPFPSLMERKTNILLALFSRQVQFAKAPPWMLASLRLPASSPKMSALPSATSPTFTCRASLQVLRPGMPMQSANLLACYQTFFPMWSFPSAFSALARFRKRSANMSGKGAAVKNNFRVNHVL